MEEFRDRFEKSGYHFHCDQVFQHHYEQLFSPTLFHIANRKGAMVEIGVGGLNSMKMWREVLPHLWYYGVDDQEIKTEEANCTILKADQSNKNQLEKAISHVKEPIWLIIDDGSHIPEHQVITFNTLFPFLKEDGVYIIEDIETSYWCRGNMGVYPTQYGYKHPLSVIEIFKNVADIVNLKFCQNYFKKEESPIQHLEYIQSITFAQNCIIITKKYRPLLPYANIYV